jgi:hypothetical protein
VHTPLCRLPQPCTRLWVGCRNHAQGSDACDSRSGTLGLCAGYQHSAFRLEVRERYNEAEEAEPLCRFLAGEPDYRWNEDWAALIASLRTLEHLLED